MGHYNRARIVMWELTRACKLACLHCTVGAQQKRSPVELSTYEAYKTIDQIAALHPEELLITGGDPLERADIYQLVDYAVRRNLQPCLVLSVTQLLTGNAIGKLRRHGLSRLAISIDASSPDRHDAARGIPGHFTQSLLAIRWARTYEMALEVNTLVTRHNVNDLETIAQLLADLSVQRWNVYFAVPTREMNRNDALTAAETEAVFERLYAIGLRSPVAIRTIEAPHYRRFVLQKGLDERRRTIDRYFESADADDASLEQQAISRATTDRSEIVFISHSGEVSISPFLPLTAGNVRYQPLATIHRSTDMFLQISDDSRLKGKCGKCEFRRICGGSRARAYAATGDLFAADPLCSYEPGQFAAAAPILSHAVR
ncbi:MAG TPA: radical SAM protein [Thermoanaerobaculia bacterium]|nr:radical SAM protein [Thermoanaerobaculia bacterium]